MCSLFGGMMTSCLFTKKSFIRGLITLHNDIQISLIANKIYKRARVVAPLLEYKTFITLWWHNMFNMFTNQFSSVAINHKFEINILWTSG